MLELEVLPERALSNGQWELTLGMPLSQATEILKLNCTVVKSVQLSYSNEKPLLQDIVLDLTNDGIRLIFDPKYQKLKIIDVYDIRKVKLKYCNNLFSAPGVTPTLQLIRHCFGPTRAGERDVKQQLYLLLFRGIVFVFPLWSASPTGNNQPLFSPDGLEFTEPSLESSLVLSKIRIFSGNNPLQVILPPLPLECYHGNSYAEKVEGLRKRDGDLITGLIIHLHLLSDGIQSKTAGDLNSRVRVEERQVSFGDSVQDVQSALGASSTVFYKDEDKTRIHCPSPHKLTTGNASDYFYNYFTLGLDVLFDGVSHRVKKLVMHTNYPGHFDFEIYNRCHFSLQFSINQEHRSSSELASPTITVTPFTKWEEVQEYLSRPEEKPVVLSRSSSTNSTNPFGYTYCYGHENVIFEVMQNSHIGSVTVYNPHFR